MAELVQGILQARYSSSRLPGKVLEDLHGAPMLQRQVERLRRCKTLDRIVLATSIEATDDPIADCGENLGLCVVRGSLVDVLARFNYALELYPADTIVRLTADCPLTDPEVIDRTVTAFQIASPKVDYLSNVLETTFPNGLDTEVFTASTLRRAHQEAEKQFDREHVTPYIKNQASRFRLGGIRSKENLSYLRWTVDNLQDLEFVRRIYKELYPTNPNFVTKDILELFANDPSLVYLES